jgi:catechol 2,3-dioxygenase-like lactoylglutathione lyase family enzyme
MKAILERSKFAQVGFIVKDIEAARVKFAALFGCEVPPSNPCGNETAGTVYKGQPAPNAKSKLAFFDLVPGVQLELIEPNEEQSTWREYLDQKGEGIHHIAFYVEGMEEVIKACESEGMTLVQYGKYDDGSGHYAYLDGSKDFKCVIELLESFDK